MLYFSRQYWVICLLFLQLFSFATEAQDLTLACNEPSIPVTATDSPNKSQFVKLLKLGKKASLNDFLILWYPQRHEFSMTEEEYEDCHYRLWTNTCSVDTVYSWGPMAKINTLKKTMPDGAQWHGDPNPGRSLSTLSSAVGSFGYGEIPIRIHLRINEYSILGEDLIKRTDRVESWSYATPEHYDEIVRDLIRFKSGSPWIGYEAFASSDGGPLFFKHGIDGNDFTEEKLKRSLLKMIRMILNGEGRIFYAADVCRNRDMAFRTRFPSYINPNPIAPYVHIKKRSYR